MTDTVQGPFPFSSSVTLPESDTAFGGLFYTPYINDSLPHNQYKKIEDSLKRVKDILEYENKSVGSGRSIGFFGVSEIQNSSQIFTPATRAEDRVSKLMQDSMTNYLTEAMHLNKADSFAKVKKAEEILWRLNVQTNKFNDSIMESSSKNYYVSLKAYRLDYETKFFIQNGTFNLAYVKWDSVIRRTYDSTRVGHYERKTIPIRYTTTEQVVLIPISKNQHRWISVGISILQVISIFLLAYFFVGFPIQILISISRGEAFSKENISRLNILFIFLVAYSFILTIAPFALHFFFRKVIPSDFHLTGLCCVLYSNLH